MKPKFEIYNVGHKIDCLCTVCFPDKQNVAGWECPVCGTGNNPAFAVCNNPKCEPKPNERYSNNPTHYVGKPMAEMSHTELEKVIDIWNERPKARFLFTRHDLPDGIKEPKKILSLLRQDLCSLDGFVRDAAGLCFASLDDPIAIPWLEAAIEKEEFPVLKKNLQLVVDQLKKTKEDEDER